MQSLKLTGGNSAFRRRAAISPLLNQLKRPHRFVEGDEASALTCGGGDKAKMIKMGLTRGMTVPVPGFAIAGGLAGAVLASPRSNLYWCGGSTTGRYNGSTSHLSPVCGMARTFSCRLLSHPKELRLSSQPFIRSSAQSGR